MKTHKELKEEYKQMKFQMGVFLIKNRVNGKVFIGNSTDLKAVWFAQKLKLNVGMHPNNDLQKDWNEFGEENFEYKILEILEDKNELTDYRKELKTLEELIIGQVQPFGDKGYHIVKIK